MKNENKLEETDSSPALAVGACYAFFYVPKHYDKIEELRAVKHTEKSVWIKGRWNVSPDKIDRSAIHSEWGSYFPTRREAVAFLCERLHRRIASAETAIANARLTLAALA